MKWISWLYIYCLYILDYYFARPALWEFVKAMVHTAETPGEVQFELVNSKHAPSCNERSCRTLLWTTVLLHSSEFLYNEHVQKQCSLEFKGTSVLVFILYFQPTCFKAFTYRAFSSCDLIPYTRNKPPSWCTTCTVCYYQYM